MMDLNRKFFDHPDRLLNELPYSQGINEFDKEGTCALANLGSWLEIGGSRNVENDIVKYASTHMDMYGNAFMQRKRRRFYQKIYL